MNSSGTGQQVSANSRNATPGLISLMLWSTWSWAIVLRQLESAHGLAAVYREPAVLAAASGEELGDLPRPQPRLLLAARAREEIDPRRAEPDLRDGLQPLVDMLGAVVLEQNHRPFRGHERPAARRMHGPQHHVPAAGGVTDIDGVGEQAGAVIAVPELLAESLEPVSAQLPLIDGGEPGLEIEGERGSGCAVRGARHGDLSGGQVLGLL